ncbi:MAG TPA: hypothetical protein VG273_27720 [Bryobacteraceae bacterium]|jgi:hypothetical protein|nr:hypothetical protein [Bryobacteraceae bacterium]
MGEPGRKDFWDKIGAATPLVLGLLVTGIGAIFTQTYNNRQLDLNKLEALDKLRPLLTSAKPEEREFGYSSFRALGYEELAIQIIKSTKDQSGRVVLQDIAKTAPPAIKSQADAALKTLDEARSLVNQSEFGTATPDPEYLKAHPEVTRHLSVDENWAQTAAKELGAFSPLMAAVLEQASVQMGNRNAAKLKDAASTSVPPPLDTREKQTAWATQFLDRQEQYVLKLAPALQPAIIERLRHYRDLVAAGDWDLKSVAPPVSTK